QAFNPQPDPPGYGMIGVAAGQTMRLNVSNVELPVTRGFPPGPCRVELTFLDSSGGELVPAVMKELPPGQSAHIDLNADMLTRTGSLRMEVRPSLKFLSTSPTPGNSGFPPGPCVTSVEIIDNTSGKTVSAYKPQSPGS